MIEIFKRKGNTEEDKDYAIFYNKKSVYQFTCEYYDDICDYEVHTDYQYDYHYHKAGSHIYNLVEDNSLAFLEIFKCVKECGCVADYLKLKELQKLDRVLV
jgi:hypothetical protein